LNSNLQQLCNSEFALLAENLYDVFVNVRDDEGEHCKTMRACQTVGEACKAARYFWLSIDSMKNKA
jgi:hypothetical protein